MTIQFVERWLCALIGHGHSWSERHRRGTGQVWPHEACIHCGKETPHGHRESREDSRSAPGAIAPAISAEPATSAPADARASACIVETEILAYRGWQLGRDTEGPCLFSVTRPVAWTGPTFVADKLPAASGSSGLYALQELAKGYENCAVVGQVALSGRVVQGEAGYRAERVAIRSLTLRYLPPTTPSYYMAGGGFMPGYTIPGSPIDWHAHAWRIAEKLAQRYACDVDVDWLPQSGLPAEYVTE